MHLVYVLVNDAPALQAANIGIAMGSGTSVAQQAANMVIVDDNFVTIVTAIRHGRAIFANIQKFILFLLGSNSVQVIFIFLCVVVGLPMPFSPLVILFVNLATDGLCSVALSMEVGENELMTLPPRNPNEPILDDMRIMMLICHCIPLAIGLICTFILGLKIFTSFYFVADLDFNPPSTVQCYEYSLTSATWSPISHVSCKDGILRARTMAFIVLAFSEILRGFTVRHWLASMWSNFFANKSLFFGSLFSLSLTLLIIFVPGVNTIFDVTSTLPYYGWVIATGWAILTCICDEIVKYHYKCSRIKSNRWKSLFVSLESLMTDVRNANQRLHKLQQQILEGNIQAKIPQKNF